MKQNRIGRVVGTIVFSLLAVKFFFIVGYAEDNFCDPYLSPRTDHPYGYNVRGDRCEGIYIKNISSTALLLVSLSSFFEHNVNIDGDKLTIKWKTPKGNAIRLRAYGVRPRLYYRMDTIRPAGATSYDWPTDVLCALRIRKDDIGIVAWTDNAPFNMYQRIYIPLQIGNRDPGTESNGYQLTLLPGRELKELFLSIATIDQEGNPATFLEKEKALKYGYYPPGRTVTIPLNNLAAPGVYYVQIGATLGGGGVTTLDFLFYHAAE